MALDNKSDDIIQLIGFHVGRKLYGTDILTVREILRAPDIEPVDQAASIVQGVLRLRGEAIPVIDMGFCLGQPQEVAVEGKTWVLICHNREHSAGFIVDSVTQIIRVSQDTIMPPPEIIVAGLRSPYITGVCDTDQGLLVVLDMNRILLNDEQKMIHQLSLG